MFSKTELSIGWMMFDIFKRKYSTLSLKLAGVLWLAIILQPGFLPGIAVAEKSFKVDSNAKIAPCKGLKPYNNLDELLYQFYINLESDCLFEMPAPELEEIWGIKILDEERRKPAVYFPLSETEFYNKPYESEKDAFYVELSPNNDYRGNIFILKITKAYFEKHGTLFPSGIPPKVISDALVKDFQYPNVHRWLPKWHAHIWSSDNFVIILIPEGYPATTQITIGCYTKING